MNDSVVVLGVHIAARVLWLAPVSSDGDLVVDRTDRLELAEEGLSLGRALSELEESLEQLVRRLQPSIVAILKPGTSRTPPAPSDSRRRGWLEGTLMIAVQRAGCGLDEVTHDAVKGEFGLRPSDKEFRERVARQISCARPPRWADRAPAYGAALVALERTR